MVDILKYEIIYPGRILVRKHVPFELIYYYQFYFIHFQHCYLVNVISIFSIFLTAQLGTKGNLLGSFNAAQKGFVSYEIIFST